MSSWAICFIPILPAALEGENAVVWLGRCWGLARRAAGPGPVQHEWRPVVEYRLPRVRIQGLDLAATWRWLLSWRMEAKELARLLGVPEKDWRSTRFSNIHARISMC